MNYGPTNPILFKQVTGDLHIFFFIWPNHSKVRGIKLRNPNKKIQNFNFNSGKKSVLILNWTLKQITILNFVNYKKKLSYKIEGLSQINQGKTLSHHIIVINLVA